MSYGVDYKFSFDGGIKKELDERWRESQPLWQQWWYEADLDTKMVTNQQDYWNTFYNINYRNQKVLQFNKLLRVHNMIGGHQRKNRLATVVQPKMDGIEQAADDASEVIRWVYEQDQTYPKISDCFDGSNMQGLNLQSIWVDYREDPENGQIRTCRLPFNSFLMDNYWTDLKGLSDCDWIWTRRYMTRQQVLSLFPKLKNDMPIMSKGVAAKDGRFQFLAQNWYQYNQELYAYDEYWKRSYKKVRRVLDRRTGEMIDWKGTREQFRFFSEINPNIEMISTMKPTVKLHVLVNNNLVYEEESPYGIDDYPFVPYVCYFYPEVQNYAYRFQGIVRAARDSQIELNKRRNRMLDVLDAQVQSGMMVKEDALVNPEDAYKQGPGQVQFFKQTANLQTDVITIQPPQIPPSTFELQKMLDEEIMSISGTTEELFGESSDKEMSGFLHQLRQGASLTSLQGIFDRLNDSQMRLGELTLNLIRENFSPEKMSSIIGRPVSEDLKDENFLKYKAVVEEGVMTTTQKQMSFMQALQLKAMGVPIPGTYLLKNMTLVGKKDLMEMVAQEEQRQAVVQQIAEMQQLNQQMVLNRQYESVAQANFASAKERESRAEANKGLAKERDAMAAHNLAKTGMDNVKTLHELQDMKDNRLMNLINFVVELEGKQKALAEAGLDPDLDKDLNSITEANQKSSQEVKNSLQKNETPSNNEAVL